VKLLCGAGALVATLVVEAGAAHDLPRDEITLWVEPAGSGNVLRGQLTLNPHRTRGPGRDQKAPLNRRVLAEAAAAFRIEVDGAPCRATHDLRELWVPAGPTLGDIVMVRCPLGRNALELRVRAGSNVERGVASVRASSTMEDPVTRSVAIAGGNVSPPYRFSGASPGWTEGGSLAIEPGDEPREEREPFPALGANALKASAPGEEMKPHLLASVGPPNVWVVGDGGGSVVSSGCGSRLLSDSGDENHVPIVSTMLLVGVALGGARLHGKRRLRQR
jgi:hypothetical protein